MKVKTRIPFNIRYLYGGDTAATVTEGTEVTIVRQDGEMCYIELDDAARTRTWIGKSKLIIPEA